jgi:hypothetical protein
VVGEVYEAGGLKSFQDGLGGRNTLIRGTIEEEGEVYKLWRVSK